MDAGRILRKQQQSDIITVDDGAYTKRNFQDLVVTT